MFVLTNDEVEASARRAAGWLASRGLRAGDRVGVVAGNRAGFVPLTMGALRTGIVPVLVNVHLSAFEQDRIVSDAEVTLVVDDESWPDLDTAPPMELARHPLARPMHYTSGTTGVSKGVWSGVLSESDAAALVSDERDLWGAEPGDTYLVCSPLYHSAPHRSAMSALLAGARVVVFETFDADAIARAFTTENVTGAFLVPTHLRRLLERDFTAPSARRVLHAGEPCSDALKLRALDSFPSGTLWEFYGSTEGQFTLCSPDEWRARPGTLGRARRGRELSIHEPDEDGVGTIFVTASSFARWEYWRDPVKTAAAWHETSFTAGDIGRLDDDGYLFMAGRREDLIISGGVNVYPAEVERVLLSHDGVVEAAVFGVDDAQWGQRVCAAVVTDGARPDEIRAWARERLPGSHAPKLVISVDALPRTSSGKVRRSDLIGLAGTAA